MASYFKYFPSNCLILNIKPTASFVCHLCHTERRNYDCQRQVQISTVSFNIQCLYCSVTSVKTCLANLRLLWIAMLQVVGDRHKMAALQAMEQELTADVAVTVVKDNVTQLTPLAGLVPDMASQVAGILKSLENPVIQSLGKEDEDMQELNQSQAAIDVGELSARLGMLQCSLLAVQGPVDPAEKLAVQLEYIEKEVS